MNYNCQACNTQYDKNESVSCPKCGELVWYERRLNLILLIHFLETHNVEFDIREVLFNPEKYEGVWEKFYEHSKQSLVSEHETIL